MIQVPEPLNLLAFDEATDEVLQRLRQADQDPHLDLEDRSIVASNNARQLHDLQTKLAAEWQRLLITERDANSDNLHATPAERRRHERDLFTQALGLLPRARKLAEIEALIAQLQNQPPVVTRGAVDAGLQALCAKAFDRALFLFARAGDPDTVADEIQNRREDDADNLLQAAHRAYAQTTNRSYDDLKHELQEQFLHPVWLIGREFQREMVQRFFDQNPTERLEETLSDTSTSGSTESAPLPLPTETTTLPLAEENTAPAPVGTNEKLALMILGGVVLLFGLLGLLVWIFGGGEERPAQALFAQTETAVAGALAQTETAVAGALVQTGTPTAVALPPTITTMPTTALTPTATTFSAPIISISNVDPTDVFTGTLPITFTVRGEHLDQVETAQLVAEGRTTIQLEPGVSASPNEVTFILEAVPEALNGAVVYKLQIDNENGVDIELRDYSETKKVRGVTLDIDTNRIGDDNGPYTSMRAERDVKSDRIGILRNDDTVDILQDDGGWYLVRIRTSNDPEQKGTIGWIEPWLVDGPPEVPTPSPEIRAFDAAVIKSFEGTEATGAFESCVIGSVNGSEGPISGTKVAVSNDRDAPFTTATLRDGTFRVCGLGAGDWTVTLREVPGVELEDQPTVTVYVNGSADQKAEVSFTQR